MTQKARSVIIQLLTSLYFKESSFVPVQSSALVWRLRKGAAGEEERICAMSMCTGHSFNCVAGVASLDLQNDPIRIHFSTWGS